MNTSAILNPLTIPLVGRHMIEASAGTGKTHNITRIYVRLLVQSKLSVQQILVMTFTEAATEEIKARIATFIDMLINDFDTKPCECSRALQQEVGANETLRLLKIAQLEIDLASIYTINGFCQRVIGRFGLSMSLPQNADLVTDFYAIQLAYVGDAIRALRTRPEQFLLLQNEKLHDPAVFMQTFGKVIGKTQSLTVQSEVQLKAGKAQEFNQCWAKNKALRELLIDRIKAQSSIFYAGTKSSSAKNTDPLINSAVDWLASEELINNDHHIAFINAWLGIEGATKDDVKKADQALINNAFKTLFSAARVKNYINEGMQRNDALLESASALLDNIKRVGVLSPEKTALKDSLKLVPFYELVYSLVTKINQTLEQHKQTFSVIGFDDQIQGLAHAMTHGGEALIESLQQEYPAALVDEFQDTDKNQYAILDYLYPEHNNERLLLMIGDPKQAIYSFRGGDIHTYMRAKTMADEAWGMDINYRSSASVIDSYNRIFHGAPLQNDAKSLFDDNIQYPIIRAPSADLTDKMTLVDDDPNQGDAAFTFICANSSRLHNKAARRKLDTSKDIQIDEIMHWCANEIKRLLGDVYIEQNENRRLVSSEDIAILVRSHKQVALVKKVLTAHGLASVFLGERSALFESGQALSVLWLLQAVQQPNRDNMRRALTTGLILFDEHKVTDSEDLLLQDNHPLWEQAFKSVHKYALLWQQKGVHALLQTVIQESSLKSMEAERQLTNYLHIAELLASASVSASSPLQLIYWLHQQITKPQNVDANELRLESDQKLIKIVTQHKSKGLEYPIVFLPYANHVNTKSSKHVAQYYLPDNTSVNELGLSNTAKQAVANESAAEDMRLLYVSLTRPILRCYLGVFSSVSCNTSALLRALDTSVDPEVDDEDTGGTMLNSIGRNLSDISNKIFLSMADKLLPIRNSIPAKARPDVKLLSFEQSINKSWHVTSFSKILRNADSRDNQFGQQANAYVQRTKPSTSSFNTPEVSFERDEEGVETIVATANDFARAPTQSSVSRLDSMKDAHITQPEAVSNATPSPSDVPSGDIEYRFVFPKGANAGTFLHDVLETIDFTQSCVSAAMNSLNTVKVDQHQVDEALLSKWFEEVLTTPLLCALGDDEFCLQDLLAANTLKEAEFYFPIEGLRLNAFSNMVNAYRQQLCTQYDLSSYPVLDLSFDMIEGAMHGFIDLIFEHNGQYYLADYKSNYLGENADSYTTQGVAQDILLHNYDVQYLIYSLALHRYLSTFLPEYSYEKHFGGVCYMYLRGMQGHTNSLTPRSQNTSANGIFIDKVSQHTLMALNDLFITTQSVEQANCVGNEEEML